MEDKVFKEKVYGPYSEAWKILKLIQYADQSSESDTQWTRFMKEIDRFNATYPENPFAGRLVRLLLDAGNDIAKMNGGGTDAIQKT